MLVSQNEIYRLCQRALEGLGAPPGIDREGAEAVAWLEARGLPGLAPLARDLERLDGDFAPLPAPTGARRSIDLAGRSALACGGLLVDLVQALAEKSPGGRAGLRIGRCRAPLFLLPYAARRGDLGWSFRLGWRDGDRAVRCEVGRGAEPDLRIAGASAGAWAPGGEPVRVALACARRRNAAPAPLRGPVRLGGEALAARLRACLAAGIAVDPAAWARLANAAARVLVEATPESRARGAGGGDANA